MIMIKGIQEQLEELFARQGVILAYLFGSQATEQAGPLSDVDVAVWLGPDVPPRQGWGDVQINLMDELARLFEVKRVDVVILNRATPLMAHQVVKYGRIIYEPDPLARIRFEVTAFHRYVDTKPLRKLQHKHLAHRIEERRKARKPSDFVW
jgi:predicted nucleotidyltransferase